jgi:hypothetical protein
MRAWLSVNSNRSVPSGDTSAGARCGYFPHGDSLAYQLDVTGGSSVEQFFHAPRVDPAGPAWQSSSAAQP